MSPFERALRGLIEAEIETLKENLALGLSIQTQEQYREAVGRISGLRSTLDLCETANDEVERNR